MAISEDYSINFDLSINGDIMSNAIVFDHISNVATRAGLNGDYSYTYASILSSIIAANHLIDDFEDDAIIAALEEIDSNFTDDFMLDFDGNEYRIIHTDSIWEIYVETIKEIVIGCYDLKLDNIPDFVAWSVDWEQTANNAFVDGYGHTFSSYDGEEIEIVMPSGILKYHAFRTN